MSEKLLPVTTGFNRSLRIESRVDRLTGDPGAVLLREIVEQSGIVAWMTSRLADPRSQVDVTHDLASLMRTGVLLVAPGWRDHDDADALRHALLRVALRTTSGSSPFKSSDGDAPSAGRFRSSLAGRAQSVITLRYHIAQASVPTCHPYIRQAQHQGRNLPKRCYVERL